MDRPNTLYWTKHSAEVVTSSSYYF